MNHLVGVLIIGSKGAVSTTLISAGLCAQTPSWTSSFLLPSSTVQRDQPQPQELYVV